MSDKIGKIDLDTFTSFLLPRLGKKDESVIVPPRTGIDAASYRHRLRQGAYNSGGPDLRYPAPAPGDVWTGIPST